MKYVVRVLATFLVAAAIGFMLFVFAFRSRNPAIRFRMRQMNAKMNAQMMADGDLKNMGQPGGPASIVRHVGRTSGEPYETPVQAFAVDDTFLIPLAYGDTADWVKNVQAAGSVELLTEGETVAAVEPEIVSATWALPLIPKKHHSMTKVLGIDQFMRLRRVA